MNDATRAQRFAAGRAVLDAVDGDAGDRVIDALADVSSELAHQVVAYGFGDIYARPLNATFVAKKVFAERDLLPVA